MWRQIHIPNFKSISQRTTEKSSENRVDGHRVDWLTTDRQMDRLTDDEEIYSPPPPPVSLVGDYKKAWQSIVSCSVGLVKINLVNKRLEDQNVFVKYDCPLQQPSPNGYLSYIGQSHKAIDPDVILTGFISWVCMTDTKFLFLMVKQLWPRLEFLLQTNTQTGQKLDAPKFHSGGIKMLFWLLNLATRMYKNISPVVDHKLWHKTETETDGWTNRQILHKMIPYTV